MHDLQRIAIAKLGVIENRPPHQLAIALDGNLARIKSKLSQQAADGKRCL